MTFLSSAKVQFLLAGKFKIGNYF